ncbi:MAG: hypothetical protein JSR37_01750 [Verrucomicrobia bacterium]|nr:hypothetical protein [Verrucomicrobiota bacterium]MBS0638077.1 hypothetical protein [Verrucomicrobiota bacterium]
MRYLTLLFIAFIGLLNADDRIFSLLPQTITPLAVEPAIPKNFVALSKKGPLDLTDWVYWGPKEVVEAYFANPESLKTSILRVRLSETVQQISPEKFSCENDELCKLMAPMGLKRLYDVRSRWGKYPVYTITAQFEHKWLYTSWVGLSDPQGTTLMFELVYPGSKPTQEQFDLWDQFIDKTKSLAADSYYISYDLGSTEVTLYDKSFLLVGEQRYSDKLIRIAYKPLKSDLKANVDTVYLANIAPQEDISGPGAKVYLVLEAKDGTTQKQMVPVFIKPVVEFSIEGNLLYEQPLPSMLKEYLNNAA